MKFECRAEQPARFLDDRPRQVLMHDLLGLRGAEWLLQLAGRGHVEFLKNLDAEHTFALLPEFDHQVASGLVLSLRVAVFRVHEDVGVNEACHGREVPLAKGAFLRRGMLRGADGG